jgi:opacity protein-like surface antigen
MKSLMLGACCLLLTAGPAAATVPPQPVVRLALLPVSGTNVHTGYLDAARDVMKDHLLATGRFTVITVAGDSGNVEISTDQALARGQESSAELVLVTHLTRLQGTGRVRMVAYRVSDGAVAHSDTIGIAGGPDDLDPAIKRLAVGLATGKRAGQAADIESVTQKDADAFRKETATKVFGVRLGTIVPLNRPSGREAGALGGVGIFWLYDARSFLAEVALAFHTGGEDATSFDIMIGGYYPFSRGNLTPYLGTAVAYSFTDFGGAGANGLRLQPAFGVLFGRLSTVQFRGELGYFFNTFGERDEDATTPVPGAVSSAKHYAHGPTLMVGLGF